MVRHDVGDAHVILLAAATAWPDVAIATIGALQTIGLAWVAREQWQSARRRTARWEVEQAGLTEVARRLEHLNAPDPPED